MSIAEIALESKSWPFIEAKRILEAIGSQPPKKGYVLFETGYGPSGLPHIGTFGEVARTSMVRHAFATLAPDIPTKLIAFSDDMDGLRKIPDNLPNQDMIAEHLGKALTSIPDPFGTHDSFGAHMNNRLQEFLDHFGFDYEFKSATATYKSGEFDQALLKVLEQFEAIMDIMLPTLGEERRATYSPFMPICPKTGIVLQTPTLERNLEAGTIVFKDEDGQTQEVPVTGGHCKLQWKPDFGMRWAALDVDYEMYGKDLIPTGVISSKICQIIGGKQPTQFNYELFLDEHGQKISKSKGNGLSLEEWLRYAPSESLAYYMYQSPRKAKRLYFDVIPKAVDEYLTHQAKFPDQETADQLMNPAWHIHNGPPPQPHNAGLSFNLLLNLAAACNPEDASVLWGFISRYTDGATPETAPYLDEMVVHALHYYEDFIKPNKHYRDPTAAEEKALSDLSDALAALPEGSPAETIQNEVFRIGREHQYENLRDWFKALYEILLGQEQGPRMGSFIELYGVEETRQLIGLTLNRNQMPDARNQN